MKLQKTCSANTLNEKNLKSNPLEGRNLHWYSLTPEETAQKLATDLERGLSEEESRARLAVSGPNKLA
jgi:magnesium-transporting ATPase (P-type)